MLLLRSMRRKIKLVFSVFDGVARADGSVQAGLHARAVTGELLQSIEGDERHEFMPGSQGKIHRMGIEHWFPIHQKLVVVTPVAQTHLQKP
jgi:hypothetical protein